MLSSQACEPIGSTQDTKEPQRVRELRLLYTHFLSACKLIYLMSYAQIYLLCALPGALGPVSMLLLTACKASAAKASSLCGQQGAHLLTSLLHRTAQAKEPDPAADTLSLLLHSVAYQQGLLGDLFLHMPAGNSASPVPFSNDVQRASDRNTPAVCPEHAIALQLLADELEHADSDNR